MTADNCGAKRRTACKGLGESFRAVFILPRQRAVSVKPTRRERICPHTWSSHGIHAAVWTLRQDKRQGNPAGFRLPLRHGQSMASALREFRIPLFLILSRENRRTRVLTTAMDVVGTAEFSGLCLPSSSFFDRVKSPYGIVLTSKNKRDRNKAMTGKARIFRVCEVFSGQLPGK